MSIRLQTTDGGKVQEGFQHEYNDCAVRALAIAANVPYAKAHAALKAQGRRDRKGSKTFMLDKAIPAVGAKFEFIRTFDITSRTYRKLYPTLQDILFKFKQGRYILITRSHAQALIDGVIHDAGSISGPRSLVRLVYKLEIPEQQPEKPAITQGQINELWERLNRLEAR
jgi:hypothetical protein